MRDTTTTNPAKDFNRTRITFMERLGSPSVPALAFKLGHLLVYKYCNYKTRIAYPAQTTLAADLGTSVRTVQRLLDILERYGLVIVPGDGRTKSSRYWIDPERVTLVSSFPAQKGDKKGRQTTSEKGDTGVAQTKKGTNRGTSKKKSLLGERERTACDSFDRTGRLDGASRSVGQQEPLERPLDPRESRAELVPAAAVVEGPFRDLLTLWDRGWPGDRTPKAVAVARVAFGKACLEAPPEDILAAAVAWRDAANAPRYLPALPQWLAARGWENPPPAKAPRASHSGRRNRPRGGKPDWGEIGARLVAHYEAIENAAVSS